MTTSAKKITKIHERLSSSTAQAAEDLASEMDISEMPEVLDVLTGFLDMWGENALEDGNEKAGKAYLKAGRELERCQKSVARIIQGVTR